MNKILFMACCMILSTTSQLLAQSSQPVKVMTFNLRYGTANDGENSWANRRDIVFDVIKNNACDFVNVQEAQYFQLEELDSALVDYAYIGRTREANNNGEASAVFYRKAKWENLENHTFWLSETQDAEGSRSWGEVLPRIVTWGKFKNRATDKILDVYNTHYSHVSDEARAKSSEMLAQAIKKNSNDTPVVVTGDFNASENSDAILTMNAFLTDTFRWLNKTAPGETFFGWNPHVIGTGKWIDYIFVKPGMKVINSRVIHYNRDGRYPSDHCPVMSEFEF